MSKTKPKQKKFSWIKFWVVFLVGFFSVNWVYQAVKKPSEILGIMDSKFYKSPSQTWNSHRSSFLQKSTPIITPDFLAALTQTETQGNAIARTYWTWKLSLNPFEIFTPASSAVGLLQITDGTYNESKNYCVHRGEVLKAGPLFKPGVCWFNGLYNRLVPSHAIEMTSAYLHTQVEKILARAGARKVSLEAKQNLAAIIHLCGPGRGESYVRRGFVIGRNEKCGAHSTLSYVRRVATLKKEFSNYLPKYD